MTKLVWAPDAYEQGTDRGVLYPWIGPDSNVYDTGVAWNGITSVDDQVLGGDREELYFDGFKYFDSIANRDYQAILRAFSAPREFGPCVGEVAVVSGFILTGQPKQRFGLSYRTMVNDTDYKIHLIYGASATPSGKTYQSRSDQPAPITFEWTIDVVPVQTDIVKETAHLVVDSRRANSLDLTSLEGSLYGTATTDPVLPDVSDVISILGL